MYNSKYTDRKITCAQYIAEQMCVRLAQKEKKKLTSHFWESKEWLDIFKRQHTLANKLLKNYSEGAVIQAIAKLAWVYSLNTKKLITEIERLDSLSNDLDVVSQPEEITQRKEIKKTNILDLI